MREKIFLISPTIGDGGRARIVLNTAKALEKNYDVEIIVFTRRVVEYYCPYKITCINCFSSKKSPFVKAYYQLLRARRIAELYKKNNPKAIIAFGDAANLAISISTFLGVKKSVAAIHGFAEITNKRTISILLKRVQRIICISKEMKIAIEEIYGKNEKLVTVENGYDIAQITKEGKEFAELSNADINLIAMGRLSKVKGYERMVLSFSNFLEKYPSAVLNILGDGEQESQLKEFVNRSGLSEKVYFYGKVDNPYAYLSKADLLLLTSYNEGFPNVLIETLACGTPIVSVDCQSGPREILQKEYTSERIRGIVKGDYGVLVESIDDNNRFAEVFSKAIQMIWEDKTLQKHYKELSFARAKEFDLNVFAKKMKRVIDSLH